MADLCASKGCASIRIRGNACCRAHASNRLTFPCFKCKKRGFRFAWRTLCGECHDGLVPSMVTDHLATKAAEEAERKRLLRLQQERREDQRVFDAWYEKMLVDDRD